MIISQKINISFNNDSAKNKKNLLEHFCLRRYLPFLNIEYHFNFAYVAITEQIANTESTKNCELRSEKSKCISLDNKMETNDC